jgi:phosphoribosylformylglycinamidine synthase
MTNMSKVGKCAVGIIQFPGSNCDTDCYDSLRRHFNIEPIFVWHKETTLPPLDAVIIPGGFSYGDYLRSGALASWSPVMAAVKEYAAHGGPILGICNGFQILTESKLLPGALIHNDHGRFICSNSVYIKADGDGVSKYHKDLKNKTLRIPIAHGEGRYYVDELGMRKLEDQGQILFRYCGAEGEVSVKYNPNGALENIAGIVDPTGKILGMMPHPERATDLFLGKSDDGLKILEVFLSLAS